MVNENGSYQTYGDLDETKNWADSARMLGATRRSGYPSDSSRRRRSQRVAGLTAIYIHCTQPPLAEVTKLLCPHHEGAGAPHPFRVGGPDLWYQMTLVDTTVERSLVSSAGGARR